MALLFDYNKSIQSSYAPVNSQNIHQPYEQYSYSPQTQTSYNISPNYSYGVNINSAGASNVSKKEDVLSSAMKAASDPAQSQAFTPKITSEPAQGQSSGISSSTIMIVAVAAVVGLFLIKR